jgi:N-terminal domain of (some) glycogen debranching enzymes/Amylo-alpha-1,6-glucosidase
MPQPHQPYLHDLITILAAPTQMLSQRTGEIAAFHDRQTVQGLIHADVRILSELAVSVNGQQGEHLATTFHDANRAQFTFVLPTVAVDLFSADPQLRLDCFRRVEAGQLNETLVINSQLPEAIEVDVEVELSCDSARLNVIKMGQPTRARPIPVMTGDHFVWVEEDVAVSLETDGADLELSDDRCRLTLRWHVMVPAHGEISVSWRLRMADVRGILLPATLPITLSDWAGAAGRVDDRLQPWLTRSLEDLKALWMATLDAPEDGFFAAGAPWYLTLFGRDSIWTARMLLPLETEPARRTLRTLSRRQGQQVNAEAAEEPGKILHEQRRETYGFGTMSLPPVYYGTIDATPLWVCLLHDAWRAGLPADEVVELLPALEQALAWMINYGDADGDGFLEYQDSSGRGLVNQGWKDSADGIRFRDGRIAEGPIALCEVQGYAYEAAMGGAALLEAFGRVGADRYRLWAKNLATRFRARFWCGQGDDRYPAIALDGAKRQVDSLSSNIGHLLGTGILGVDEELLIARQIASPALDSGLGLRTMAATDAGYAPLSYHCGSVWPHDTAIVVAGLVRAGLADFADGLIEGLLRASVAFEQRLPELWSGEGRPVPYPAACRPQAWSAASAVVVAHALSVL